VKREQFGFLFVLLMAMSCLEQDQSLKNMRKLVSLNFELGQFFKGIGRIITIDHVEVSSSGLQSEFLREEIALHQFTRQRVKTFVLVADKQVSLATYRSSRCYSFSDRCLEYGTLLSGNTGYKVFIPADLETKLLGFGNICHP
jgi:hypothetical protein